MPCRRLKSSGSTSIASCCGIGTTKINLTRHTDYGKFVGRDVLDSMQLAEHLREGDEILDVGTGGGVPGIVLAIVRPDLQVFVR